MYMVMRLTQGIVVQLFGQEVKIPLNNDQVEGAIFVFSDKEKAEKFAGGEYEIVELHSEPPKAE